MTRIQLQFHATAEELLQDFLPAWLPSAPYFFALLQSDGSVVDRSGVSGPLRVGAVSDDIAEVVIRLAPFEAVGGSALEYLRHNVGFLAVSIPKVRDNILRECSIGSVAEDQASVNAWRTVVRRAKRELLRGAVMVGLDGSRRFEPRHLYSAGAAAMSAEGVRMLAIAGGVQYEFVGTS